MPNSDYFREAFQPDDVRREQATHTLWTAVGTLYRRRWFIGGVTGTVAVLVVVLTLLMDNWYRADARLLLPPRTGTGLLSAAVMSNLPSSARSLLGGSSGDYSRYLSILTSRAAYEGVADSLDLVTVYGVEEDDHPREEAIKLLIDNSAFEIDDEYEYLIVSAYDTDPERAAAMANLFVRELNRINSELSSESARIFRRYVEARYDEAVASLDSVMMALQMFQERYGVLELQQQGEQFFEYLALLRRDAIQVEAEYETLLSQLGPENSQVRAAAAAVASANRKYEQALAGQERLLPVAKDDLPAAGLEYAMLERERLVLSTLLEFIYPVLEEARFDEQRQIEAVQVVDRAVPPVEKAYPRRSIICILATLSAFLLSGAFVLVQAWWRRNHAYLAHRLRAAADASEAPGPPEAPRAPADAPVPARPVAAP